MKSRKVTKKYVRKLERARIEKMVARARRIIDTFAKQLLRDAA